MKPAARRTWRVGDQFSVNYWREGASPSLVFVITRRTPTTIWFWAPSFDPPGSEHGRSVAVRAFLRDVRRRELVRVLA